MKNLLTILFVFMLTQVGFGQSKNDSIIINWDNGQKKYMEFWASDSIRNELEVNESVAIRIHLYFDKNENEINVEEFIQLYGNDEHEKLLNKITLNKLKYKTIDFMPSTSIDIDTTIFIDGTVSKDTNIKILNYSALFNYYSKHIASPPHGGDPNYATVSFIIDTLGHVNYVYIIEDVLNKTNDEPWKWYDDNGFQFSSLIVNGKPYIVEYQIKIDDLCYCAPLIYKEHKARKRKEKRKRK